MRRVFVAILIPTTILLASCNLDAPCEDMAFGRLTSADRAVVRTNNMRDLREITDAATIDKLTAFAISHADNWETPIAGTPVAMLRVDFYSGNDFLGDFGLGSDFLSAQGCGFFQSRSVDPKDREALLQLFGVPDPYKSSS